MTFPHQILFFGLNIHDYCQASETQTEPVVATYLTSIGYGDLLLNTLEVTGLLALLLFVIVLGLLFWRFQVLVRKNQALSRSLIEQEKVKQALRESEQRFYTVVQNMPVMMNALNEQGIATLWNRECERVTGYSAAEIENNPQALKKAYPDEAYLEYVLAEWAKHPGDFREWELDITCKDGTVKTVAWSSVAEEYPVVGWASWTIGVDVTDRKKAENALRERTAQLESLRKIALELTAQLDREKLLETIVSQAIELLGGNKGVLNLYQPDRDVLEQAVAVGFNISPPGTTFRRGEGLSGKVWETRQPMTMEDYSHWPERLTPYLKYGWSAVVAVPIQQGDIFLGVLIINAEPPRTFSEEDVGLLTLLALQAAIAIQNARLFEQERTQRERAESLAVENADLYKQARRDAETKAILLHEVNHRVKNNLAAIIGLLYAELRHAGMEKQAAYHDVMEDLINRTQGLATVHAMLSESQWAPLPLSKLTEQIINAVLQTLPLDREVTAEVSPSPVQVSSKQANHLALLINELATNSIKYALAGSQPGRIRVRIDQENDHVILEFRDNGPGYPEEVLKLERHNVGIYLVRAITRNDLLGDLQLHNDNGAVTTIRFPVEQE